MRITDDMQWENHANVRERMPLFDPIQPMFVLIRASCPE